MMRTAHLIVALFVTSSMAFAQTIEVVNNQPFDVRMPFTLRGVKLDAGVTSAVAQQAGDDLVVMVEAPASTPTKVSLAVRPDTSRAVTIKPADDGVALSAGGKDMGKLAWGIFVGPAPTKREKGEPAPSTKQDFAAGFKPLALTFSEPQEGVLFSTSKATATHDGLRLDVVVHAYKTGFLDWTATLSNESAPKTSGVYAAVVCRWQQPKVAGQTLGYDNRRQELAEGSYSPFRSGEGRHLYVQRGVDWVNTRLEDGTGVVWLNDFAPSFTFHRPETTQPKKKGSSEMVTLGSRWVGANSAQLGQEAQAAGGALYSITEIARPNIGQYAARLEDNILPDKEQPLSFTSRMMFEDKAPSDDEADNRFVAYAGYNPQQVTTVGGKITFGVPFTRMGTNYFPYSTLGENFGDLRMEGMSKEGYWPLAPQTVLQWQKFADDVRRDLRILKAMGFELCRLHHLELLWDIDPKTNQPYVPAEKRWEYLDFFFGELEKLQLKALLDVKLPPDELADLVKRYRNLCDGVEYDNEVLIFQIYDADVPVWKAAYEAVKKVAPDMPFHLTAHTNTGAFDRVAKLGVKIDRFGQHAYLDGVEPIPSSRGYAMAHSNYAAKHGKEPQITEWNWRFLTRMPMEERAKVYAPIFENPMKARTTPVIYQFQFQDSLAMNPTTLKGIRRYEQILLSRRPKPEAFEMMRMIEQYGAPDSGVRSIGVSRPVMDLGQSEGRIEFEVTNRTPQPMPVVMAVEGPAEVKATIGGRREIVLAPGKPARVPVTVALAEGENALPGFYHVFLRIHAADDTLRYGWAEVRKPGNVTMDRASHSGAKVEYGPGAMEFDFNRPLTVVYPDEASVLELESAWTVFITLESATGRPVQIYQASDLAKAPSDGGKRTVVLVTREKDAGKPSVRVDGERLVISGGSEDDVMAACMDLVVRFWKNAKDAGARKVGLVAAPAGEGGVKTDLD